MKQIQLSHKLVELIPERLNDGVIYISKRYNTAIHKCCCGCGEEVVTPLNTTDWKLKLEGNTVTLHPSIGNWSFACKSHYWIRRSKVIWSYQMSQQEIEHGRTIDRNMKNAYYKTINYKKQSSNEFSPQNEAAGLLDNFWLSFKRWWNS